MNPLQSLPISVRVFSPFMPLLTFKWLCIVTLLRVSGVLISEFFCCHLQTGLNVFSLVSRFSLLGNWINPSFIHFLHHTNLVAFVTFTISCIDSSWGGANYHISLVVDDVTVFNAGYEVCIWMNICKIIFKWNQTHMNSVVPWKITDFKILQTLLNKLDWWRGYACGGLCLIIVIIHALFFIFISPKKWGRGQPLDFYIFKLTGLDSKIN